MKTAVSCLLSVLTACTGVLAAEPYKDLLKLTTQWQASLDERRRPLPQDPAAAAAVLRDSARREAKIVNAIDILLTTVGAEPPLPESWSEMAALEENLGRRLREGMARSESWRGEAARKAATIEVAVLSNLHRWTSVELAEMKRRRETELEQTYSLLNSIKLHLRRRLGHLEREAERLDALVHALNTADSLSPAHDMARN